MPSDGRYMYPHPPPNMSYDYGAYQQNTYDNSQYPPGQPAATQRPPHPVNAKSFRYSRVFSLTHDTSRSRHIHPIMVRLPITSFHNNHNGKHHGRRILLLCLILLPLDNLHLSRWSPDRNHHRQLKRLGTNLSNRWSNLRNRRNRNCQPRRFKRTLTEV